MGKIEVETALFEREIACNNDRHMKKVYFTRKLIIFRELSRNIHIFYPTFCHRATSSLIFYHNFITISEIKGAAALVPFLKKQSPREEVSNEGTRS